MTSALPKLTSQPRGEVLFAARAALASVSAVAVAEFCGLPYPIYALLAAVLVLDRSPHATRQHSLYRLMGSVLGTIVGALSSQVLGPGLWVLACAVFAAMAALLLYGQPEAAKVSGYVAGIVVLNYSQQPWSYALIRCLETMIGIVAALVMALAFLPLHRRDASGPGGNA